MTTATRMAIQQSTPISVPVSLSGTDRRYETEKYVRWNAETYENDAVELVYEVSWILERRTWRWFLLSTKKV